MFHPHSGLDSQDRAEPTAAELAPTAQQRDVGGSGRSWGSSPVERAHDGMNRADDTGSGESVSLSAESGQLHPRLPPVPRPLGGRPERDERTVPPDWRELGEEDCDGLPECASWIPLAADFTQDGATVTGTVTSTFAAPPNYEWTVQSGTVSVDGTLSL